jgi:hypothetical protein
MNIDFSEITVRQQISNRGGGVEIDLTTLGFPNVCMTAYQNYLGGGMLGRVCNSCMISDWEDYPKLVEIAQGLRKYFHNLTNPDSEWESTTYEQNQNLPTSAY